MKEFLFVLFLCIVCNTNAMQDCYEREKVSKGRETAFLCISVFSQKLSEFDGENEQLPTLKKLLDDLTKNMHATKMEKWVCNKRYLAACAINKLLKGERLEEKEEQALLLIAEKDGNRLGKINDIKAKKISVK
ncbi:MAG: hypothetical protein LBI26_02630 [Holosporales bacterium]|nr:hypothetical protein [Holosporales bacterium]